VKKYFKLRPQSRILVPHGGSFQNFRRAPSGILYVSPPGNKWSNFWLAKALMSSGILCHIKKYVQCNKSSLFRGKVKRAMLFRYSELIFCKSTSNWSEYSKMQISYTKIPLYSQTKNGEFTSRTALRIDELPARCFSDAKVVEIYLQSISGAQLILWYN